MFPPAITAVALIPPVELIVPDVFNFVAFIVGTSRVPLLVVESVSILSV